MDALEIIKKLKVDLLGVDLNTNVTKEELDYLENYIKDSSKLIAIFKRIVDSKDTWYDTEFGVGESSVYIDGLTRYKDDSEKELIKEFINKKLC